MPSFAPSQRTDDPRVSVTSPQACVYGLRGLPLQHPPQWPPRPVGVAHGRARCVRHPVPGGKRAWRHHGVCTNASEPHHTTRNPLGAYDIPSLVGNVPGGTAVCVRTRRSLTTRHAIHCACCHGRHFAARRSAPTRSVRRTAPGRRALCRRARLHRRCDLGCPETTLCRRPKPAHADWVLPHFPHRFRCPRLRLGLSGGACRRCRRCL